MSIPIECPECGARYSVSEDMAGRSIRCRECDADVPVPDEEDDRPRRRERPRAKRSSNLPLILGIVGGALALGCLICAGVGGVMFWGATKVAKAVDEELNAGLIPPGVGPVILNQQGVVLPNDPVRDGRPQKQVKINLQQGKQYVIDLQSEEMDSFLSLYDPGGVNVAADDDSGGMLNSRIRFTADRTGEHTIGCGALGGAGGLRPGGSRFTLTVRQEN
jgi:predicted Zn finger-like uncharacterized protein